MPVGTAPDNRQVGVDPLAAEPVLRPDRIDTLLWSGKALEFEDI